MTLPRRLKRELERAQSECVADQRFQTRGEARQTVFEYVECFYNRVGRHSSLGYVSPVIFEQHLC